MLNNNKLLSRKETAELLGVKTQTLAAWACHGRYNLKFVKVGKKVLYKLTDVHEFIDHNTRTSTQ